MHYEASISIQQIHSSACLPSHATHPPSRAFAAPSCHAHTAKCIPAPLQQYNCEPSTSIQRFTCEPPPPTHPRCVASPTPSGGPAMPPSVFLLPLVCVSA
jgi:hypothetical protein